MTHLLNNFIVFGRQHKNEEMLYSIFQLYWDLLHWFYFHNFRAALNYGFSLLGDGGFPLTCQIFVHLPCKEVVIPPENVYSLFLAAVIAAAPFLFQIYTFSTQPST